LAFRLGYVRPGAQNPGEEVGLSRTSSAPLYTTIRQPSLTIRHHFAPAAVVSPVVGAGIGMTSWRVLDKTGTEAGWVPRGDPIMGYDIDGNPATLEGSNFTILLELGLDVSLTEALTVNLGARYGVMSGNRKDNVGLSSYWGPEHVDANTGLSEAFVGLTWRFGANDRDGDGVPNDRDQCPDQPEDRDGYNDTDGCPDPDNDGDGILDADDACPTRAEDRDGFQDQDGCPDPDNDGDGIYDGRDQCPDEAEDIDGWDDQDGCPDPDNDQDGVPDSRDQCPRTPADSKVDANGCVVPVPTVAADVVFVPAPTGDTVLEGVTFVAGSAALEPGSIAVLVELAATLRADSLLQIEIRGYTDSAGDAEVNRALAQRRAESVRASLIQLGIAPERLTAIGFGEDSPAADNSTSEGRARNRRVEIHRR
jgi:outer membrane protein OmpA-like peptidoglycan-associated protein